MNVPRRAPRLLLLSYAFPPMWMPEAVLAAKRFAGLDSWQVDVICAEPFASFIGSDDSLEDYVAASFGSVRQVRRPRWARKLTLGRFDLLVRIPDPLRWLNGRVRRVARAAGLHSYDAMISWSQWHSIHIAALGLRRSGGPPWIAHMSDPWSRNPFSEMSAVEYRINERLERRVVDAADAITLTAPAALDFLAGGEREDVQRKVRFLPHSFDPSLYPQSNPPRVGKLRLLYVGNFYGLRTPRPLFAALAAARSLRPQLFDEIEVHLIGRVDAEMLGAANAYGLPPDCVTAHGPVDYVASLREMMRADILLVVDAPLDRSPFLPSKLVDYVGACRPIVALTPMGPAADLTRRVGGWTADPRSPQLGGEALVKAIDHVARERDRDFGDPSVRREFDNRAVAGQLEAVLERAQSANERG